MIFILSLTFIFSATAGNEAYTRAMQEAIAAYDSVKGLDDYQEIANRFERISEMEKNEWLPLYYTGLTYAYMSFENGLDNDQRDAYLETAQNFADQAEELSPENVEIIVLKGYIKMAKLTVNPSMRGAFLTPQVMQLFGKARAMDPANPRATAMLARMKYGTAQFFNSSTDESCQLAQESLELYDKEGERGIQPQWGRNVAEQLVKTCNRINEELPGE